MYSGKFFATTELASWIGLSRTDRFKCVKARKKQNIFCVVPFHWSKAVCTAPRKCPVLLSWLSALQMPFLSPSNIQAEHFTISELRTF